MENANHKILQGNCLDLLKTLPRHSVDSIVTDPPAGIGFMNKEWDSDKGGRDQWIMWLAEIMREALEVLKPGGHALVWALPRTSHWTATALENAGFEIRDIINHIFATGFPKSLNLGDGFGTALKPAVENWILCRKPIEKGLTIKQNFEKWGTGGLNIDATRIPASGESFHRPVNHSGIHDGWDRPWRHQQESLDRERTKRSISESKAETLGRFPSNLIHDGSAEIETEFAKFGNRKCGGSLSGNEPSEATKEIYGKFNERKSFDSYQDSGSASRFFFCAKASQADRNEGLEDFEVEKVNDGRRAETDYQFQRGETLRKNTHPTVKNTNLMRYLCRLITPPGGTVLDMFCGSGSTGKACVKEGFGSILIDIDEENCRTAAARIKHAINETENEHPLIRAAERENADNHLEHLQTKLF